MGFEVTKISKSAAAVEFVDMWGDRIAVQHEPGANLEVSWSNRDMRNIILNRDLAATAGRILLAYARDGDLSGAEAAIAGTDAKPADADLDRFAEIERRLGEAEDAQAQQAGWLGEHRQRLDAVEEKIAEAADGAVKVPVTVVKTWTPKVGDRVIDKGGPGYPSSVGEGEIVAIDTDFSDGRTRYVVRSGCWQRHCLLEHLEPAPPRDRTPQEIADEMTARFPVGTKVKFRFYRGARLVDDGEILGPFFVGPDGEPWAPIVTATGTHTVGRTIESAE